MKGIIYKVKNNITEQEEIMKLTENTGLDVDVYSVIKKYKTDYFVMPTNILYTDNYPEGFEYPPSVENICDVESWLIYTMPEYNDVNIGKIKPEKRKELFTNILKEYSYLQNKTGFIQGGDMSGNIMLNGKNLVVIDLDDCFFSNDKNTQLQDSESIVEDFEYIDNPPDLTLLLKKLKKLHTSKWNKYFN